MCAALNWTILITKLFKSCAKQYSRKIINFLLGGYIDIYIIRNKVKIIKSCSELVRGSSSQIREINGLLPNEVKIEERGSLCESIRCSKNIVEAIEVRAEMCPREKMMRF